MKKDFFARYRDSRKHHYIVPAIFALALSVSVVGMIREGRDFRPDLGALSANVVHGLAPEKKYDADLLIERSGSDIVIRMGKSADTVDTLTVTLVGDPTLFTGLSTIDPTLSIEARDPGMYIVRADIRGESLRAGDMVTGLTALIDPKGAIAPVDARFMSKGVEYGLSVKGE